jgi:hypothetical protein
MNCGIIRFSRHAMQRMFERGIDPENVREIVETGEIIETYPDDTPYPSALLFGRIGERPVHVVVARDPACGECYVVTAYEPEAALWGEDFRTRRLS